MKPILILGIGNILLRDEGVGVRLIEAMHHVPLPDNVELLDGGTSGADLVDAIADRRKLIVIDAVKADAKPGAVFRFTMDELLRDESRLSLHEFGLLDTLDTARRLGCPPAEVVVFGVQPAEIEFGLELSEPVAAIVPRLIEVVLDEARKPAGNAAARGGQITP